MRRVAWLALAVSLAGAPCLLGCGGSGGEVRSQRRELPPPDPRAVRQFVAGVKHMGRPGRANERRAVAYFERALVLDANLWEAHHNLGVLARRGGRVRDAAEHFQAALEIQPGSRSTRLALAETRYALGDRSEASDLLEGLVERDPEAMEARVALATMLREQGAHDRALAHAREVLIRHPSNVHALAEVGRVYLARERHDVAALVFKKALTLLGDENAREAARIHNDMGLLELARGDTQLAFQHFAKAIEADPRYAPARMNQGAVLLKAGDYAGALAEYETVVELDPSHLDARVALGAALRGLGKHRQAGRQYQRVLKESPNHPAALFNLAVLRADFLNQRPRARLLFEKFLKVAPDGDPHRREATRYLEEIPAPKPKGGQS
ncbi:MAG: tetratricopeptide repeat protein [Myxococcota bacterium]